MKATKNFIFYWRFFHRMVHRINEHHLFMWFQNSYSEEFKFFSIFTNEDMNTIMWNVFQSLEIVKIRQFGMLASHKCKSTYLLLCVITILSSFESHVLSRHLTSVFTCFLFRFPLFIHSFVRWFLFSIQCCEFLRCIGFTILFSREVQFRFYFAFISIMMIAEISYKQETLKFRQNHT